MVTRRRATAVSRLRSVLLTLIAALVLAGCGSTRVAGGFEGGSFVLVSPGGKLEFEYPIAERQSIGDFSGTSVTDKNATITLSDYPDTVLVINFWGSWCGPCRAEAPDLEAAAELSRDRKVQFIGINVQDTRENAADFMAAKSVSFPSIFDPTMRSLLSMQGYPANWIPSTIVLDRQHRVAHIFGGRVSVATLDPVIASVAAEPAP